MREQKIPYNRSSPFWTFEEIHSTWRNKEFHMMVTCDNDTRMFYETNHFDSLLFEREYFMEGCISNVQGTNLKYCLDNKGAMHLRFEVRFYLILMYIQSI